MQKIWHPYWDWEDFQQGMWRRLTKSEEKPALELAVEFTGDADLYGSWMMRVVQDYPIACQHNLTDPSLNRQAWVGHAACCMAHKLPEYIVRKAWAMLSNAQRQRANLKADEAVSEWEYKYAISGGNYGQFCFDFRTANSALHQDLGGARI